MRDDQVGQQARSAHSLPITGLLAIKLHSFIMYFYVYKLVSPDSTFKGWGGGGYLRGSCLHTVYSCYQHSAWAQLTTSTYGWRDRVQFTGSTV